MSPKRVPLALLIPCPLCGSAPGVRCVERTPWTNGPVKKPHEVRWRDAQRSAYEALVYVLGLPS